jgi:hypothetical protein
LRARPMSSSKSLTLSPSVSASDGDVPQRLTSSPSQSCGLETPFSTESPSLSTEVGTLR